MATQRGVYRELLRATSIYAIGLALQRAASLLLLPLYTRYLSPADYGTLELLDVTMSVFSVVAGVRIAASLAYFHANAGSEEERREVMSTHLAGSMAVGIIGAIAGWFLAPLLSDLAFTTPGYAKYFRIMLMTFAFSVPLEASFGRLRVENRAGLFVVFNLIHLLLSIGFNVLFLVGMHMNFEAILWTNLIVSSAVATFLAWSGFRSFGFRFRLKFFWQMARFAAPLGIVGLSQLVFHVADRYFLQRHATLDAIGTYALAYKFGMLVTYVHAAFNGYWTAQSYELLKGEQGPRIFSRTFTYLMTAMTLATVAIWAFSPWLIGVFTTEAFHTAAAFVPVILLAYLARSASDYLRTVFYTTKRTGWDAVISVLYTVVCLAGYAYLIPRYQAWGAAWATLITSCVMLVLSYAAGHRLVRFTLEGRRLSLLALITALFLAALQMVPAGAGMPVRLLAGICAVLMWTAVLWLSPFLTGDEKSAATRLFSSLRARVA